MISKYTPLLILFLFVYNLGNAQTLHGIVVDSASQKPLEMVAVYFDNTTIGTTTDENGKFSITYTDAIQSTLVVSYLGYEKVYISNYRQQRDLKVNLVEAKNELDEVVVEYNDELTRKQKLKLFRTYFLGTSVNGKSCKILNEEDLFLNYNKPDQSLSASSKSPIIVYNKALGYKLSYDLNDFEVQFRYANAEENEFTMHSAYYLGTVFFEDLNKNKQRKRIDRRREKTFKGSIQHFMRALYNNDLEAENYTIYQRGFRVNEWDYITIEPLENSDFKRVTIRGRISIMYNKKIQSDMYLDSQVNSFSVNAFGHHVPIIGVYFTGYMNNLRVGDMLPLEFGLEKEKLAIKE